MDRLKLSPLFSSWFYDSSNHCLFHFPGSSTLQKANWLKIEQICLLKQHRNCEKETIFIETVPQQQRYNKK